MNYSLADSLRFVRHLTTSDLDTDNVDLLHVIGEHLENLRNSGDESAKELLKEKAQSLGEWVDLNPERTFDFKLEKDEEEHKALLEERRYVRRQIDAIDRQNNEAYLMEREVRLERENNTVINRQNDIARQELVRQCAVVLAQLEVESKKFLEFVKSGEAQKVVESVEAHLGKEEAKKLSDYVAMNASIASSGVSDAMIKMAKKPDISPKAAEGIVHYANIEREKYDYWNKIMKHKPPKPEDLKNYYIKTNESVLVLLIYKKQFTDPEFKDFYNSDVYKKFEAEVAIIAKQMGAPDPNSHQFKEWLQEGNNKKLFLEAKISTGMTIESSLDFISNKQKLGDERASIQKSISSLKENLINESNGVIEGYAKYLNEVQMDIAPKILKRVAVSITEDAWLNKEYVDKEKFSVLKVESPAHSGKFIEMQVYTNEPGNSTEATRKVFTTVANKYLTTALDPEILGLSRNGKEYIGFVNSYLSQYLSDDPKLVILPNSTNGEEVVINKLNAGLMKLTSVNTFIKANPDIADRINIEHLLNNENLRSQLKEGLIAQIQYSRNETPTEEYLNSVIDKLLRGEFKSTIEFYAQESAFAEEYKNGNIKSNIANDQDKGKVAELADNNEILNNISSMI